MAHIGTGAEHASPHSPSAGTSVRPGTGRSSAARARDPAIRKGPS